MGVGLDGSPVVGDDPKVVLTWSDDGGRNFGGHRLLSLGRIGEYRNRAITKRLGFGRRRKLRISGSDPVKTILFDVTVKAEPMSR